MPNTNKMTVRVAVWEGAESLHRWALALLAGLLFRVESIANPILLVVSWVAEQSYGASRAAFTNFLIAEHRSEGIPGPQHRLGF